MLKNFSFQNSVSGPNDTSKTAKIILAVSQLLSLFRGIKSFAFWLTHTTSENSKLFFDVHKENRFSQNPMTANSNNIRII